MEAHTSFICQKKLKRRYESSIQQTPPPGLDGGQTIDKPRQSAKAGVCCREKQKRAKKKEETIRLIF